MRRISASDANRHFSALLREVARGEVITVLSRNKAVATISPVRPENHGREAARRALLERLRRQEVIQTRSWTRDELYEG